MLGVNLTSIITKQVLNLDWLQGKIVAVDANNYLYQFLSLVRTRNGTPLKDSEGHVTSHLAGLMFRSTRLIHDYKIDLVFVFDGQPPELKKDEIARRRQRRNAAHEEWQRALKAGDYKKAFSKAVVTSRLTQSMIKDAKKLLSLLGIPFVQALGEAEAQAAYMAIKGHVWGASSKDYDTLLFGAPRLVRFLTIHGKEFLPSKGVTRPLKPELINLQTFLLHHKIELSQLIDLAILVGTDFNNGIKGVGPKTALKLVKEYKRIENLPTKFLSKLSPNYSRVRELFLNPETTSNYRIGYSRLQENKLFNFLCDQRDFERKRVETIVERMKNVYRLKKQPKLEEWL